MHGCFVGCAGWSIPREHAGVFPGEGPHLARDAHVFPAVELDSSFHRLHREDTYARWAATVPEGFRFAVWAPRGRVPGARPVHLRQYGAGRGGPERAPGVAGRGVRRLRGACPSAPLPAGESTWLHG